MRLMALLFRHARTVCSFPTGIDSSNQLRCWATSAWRKWMKRGLGISILLFGFWLTATMALFW